MLQSFVFFFYYAASHKQFETGGKHTHITDYCCLLSTCTATNLINTKENVVVESNAIKSLLLSTLKPLEDVLDKDCKNDI